MSEFQRVIVRLGVSADVPALHFGELGMDTDTITMRIGDDTSDPPRIMTTKSTGDFDFSRTGTVKFNEIEFAPGGGVAGLNFASLKANVGVVISVGNGAFREVKIGSSDGTVIVSNGDGTAGDIDLAVSNESIQGAVADLRNQVVQLGDQITTITENDYDRDDTLLKLVQLSGEPAKRTDLGVFSGTTIPDGSTIRTALQALETAVEQVNGASYELQIVAQSATQFGLELNPDNIVVVKSATEALAGLMSASDKTKLDSINVSALANQGIRDVVAVPTAVELDNTSATLGQITIPAVTHTNAGVMLPGDKTKLDTITSTQNHDLDAMDTAITALQQNPGAQAFFVETSDAPLFSTNINSDTTSHVTATIPLTGLVAFGIYYSRLVDGYEPVFYDEIETNGINVLDAEMVTKSHSGAISVYKAKSGAWYYLNRYGYANLLAPSTATSLTVTAGTTNEMTIRKLTVG